ncbi:MAG: ATP-dependent metallopeptidase FtsH/Yme1/Tma family protein, partial [Lachnospiraceae bacterium]
MDNNQNKNNNNKKDPKNNKQGLSIIVFTTLITAFLVFGLYQFMQDSTSKEITYSKFLKMVDEGKVKKVEIDSDRLVITPKKQDSKAIKVTYYTGVVRDETLSDRLYKAGIEYGQVIPDSASAMLFNMFISIILPFAIIWIGLSFIMRRMSKGGGMMGVGKSNAKLYVEKETGITFKDVAGQDEAKESLQEV